MATPTTTLTPEQSAAALQTLLNGPAAPPPAGVTSDFDHTSNISVIIPLTLTLCITFTTLAILMRMYTKLFLVRSIAPEDYAVVLGWLGLAAEIIPSVFTLKHGNSLHMWNVRLKDFLSMLYYLNIFSILYGPIIFSVKLSILLQYLRIFVPTRKGNMVLFVGVHICIWSCFVCYLVTTAFLIAMCNPREKLWKPYLPGHCFSYIANYQATGIFNVISDFVILILPIPSVWKLQLPLRKKLGVIAVFATGFFACVTSIARAYYTWRFADSPDFSYNINGLGLWSWGEIATGIIVSCLPVLPKFFQHVAPKFHGHTTSEHKSVSSGITKTIVVSSKYEQPLGQSGGVESTAAAWNDAYDSRAQLRGEYITLEDYDRMSSKTGTSVGQAGRLTGDPAPHTREEV